MLVKPRSATPFHTLVQVDHGRRRRAGSLPAGLLHERSPRRPRRFPGPGGQLIRPMRVSTFDKAERQQNLGSVKFGGPGESSRRKPTIASEYNSWAMLQPRLVSKLSRPCSPSRVGITITPRLVTSWRYSEPGICRRDSGALAGSCIVRGTRRIRCPLCTTDRPAAGVNDGSSTQRAGLRTGHGLANSALMIDQKSSTSSFGLHRAGLSSSSATIPGITCAASAVKPGCSRVSHHLCVSIFDCPPRHPPEVRWHQLPARSC